MKQSLYLAGSCVCLVALIVVGSTWSQPPAGGNASPSPKDEPSSVPTRVKKVFQAGGDSGFSFGGSGGGFGGSGGGFGGSGSGGNFYYYDSKRVDSAAPGGPARNEVTQLAKQLSEVTEEAQKPDIMKKLEAAVAKLFDEDLKVREKELTELEERLKKLNGQLERRRKSKAEIVQLQLKVLANEAEGLGFNTGPVNSDVLFFKPKFDVISPRGGADTFAPAIAPPPPGPRRYQDSLEPLTAQVSIEQPVRFSLWLRFGRFAQ